MIKTGIYKISSLIDDRIYIGSSLSFVKRRNDHLLHLKKNKHCSPILQNFYNKYGVEALKFELIHECEPNELITIEQSYIDTLKPVFNVCKIAGSPLGVKHSEETKRNHSERRKGKAIHDDAFKKRLSQRNAERKWSEESKLKSSLIKKGCRRPEGFSEMIKKVHAGKPKSEEHRLKIGQANKGRIINEKTRLAVAEANRRRAKSYVQNINAEK